MRFGTHRPFYKIHLPSSRKQKNQTTGKNRMATKSDHWQLFKCVGGGWRWRKGDVKHLLETAGNTAARNYNLQRHVCKKKAKPETSDESYYNYSTWKVEHL